MANGTVTLIVALRAAGIQLGDEVIVPAYTFAATAYAPLEAGAIPVIVDIDPSNYCMDPQAVEAAITPRTRAILPVHLHGQTAEMEPILAIARKHGLIVIEDAAQAHGAEYRGQRAGSLGDMACFSFYPGKNLGAYGEGGMVVTDNPDYARKIRMLRDWGAEKRYHHELKGFNYRLEGIQGAVLRVKLRHLEKWTEARRAAAARYDKLLEGSGVVTPTALPHNRHVYHVYAIRTAKRQAWQEALQARGVATGIHYPIPVHLLTAFADLGYERGDFPHSERAANEVLSLPMFAELTPAQSETVANAVRELAAAG
jgi:dTDP-4-amino-4,6-dideoxygalactose transaminase